MDQTQGLSKREWDAFWADKCETCRHGRIIVFISEVEKLAGDDGCYPITVGEWSGDCLRTGHRITNLGHCGFCKSKGAK